MITPGCKRETRNKACRMSFVRHHEKTLTECLCADLPTPAEAGFAKAGAFRVHEHGHMVVPLAGAAHTHCPGFSAAV